MRKNFIPRNEAFVCEVCSENVPPAKGTFRNHCPKCLTSKHVDGATPGDRTNNCGGQMAVIGIEGTNTNKLDIVHACNICGKVRRNRTANDDSKERIFALLEDVSYK